MRESIPSKARNRSYALFAGFDGGAENWVIAASLIETCKLDAFAPFAYLSSALADIVTGYKQAEIGELLPSNFGSNGAQERTLESKVVISVDLHFSLGNDDQDSDFWVVSSATNVQQAVRLRKTNRVKSITTFNDLGDDVKNVASMLPTIIEHHPNATVIIVQGIKASDHIDVIRAAPASWGGRSSDSDVTMERIAARNNCTVDQHVNHAISEN